MDKTKFLLFSFLILPQVIFTSVVKTGDAFSKATLKINSQGQNVIIQGNEVKAISNTGGSTDTSQTSQGDAAAVSEVNIKGTGSVEASLQVQVNGDKKELKVDKPGSYKLESAKNKSSATATVGQKQSQNILAYFLKFLFDFIKKRL